jgi:hypothetical protein
MQLQCQHRPSFALWDFDKIGGHPVHRAKWASTIPAGYPRTEARQEGAAKISNVSRRIRCFCPPSPDNPLYWEIEALKREAFYINDVPYILLTEGVFKALAGCSNGIPTISLLGVEQGLTGKARDPENQRFLVPALRKLAEAGFGFIIAFDADAATNPNVRAAERNWLSNWLNSMCQ